MPVIGLFTPSALTAPAGIDLRCADVREIVAVDHQSVLVHADGPWCYHEKPGVANPDDNGIYDSMTDAQIVEVMDASYEHAAPGARLVCWTTWPKLGELVAAGGAGRWKYVTGGAWTKRPHVGVGYHWRGHTEPVLVFTKPGARTILNRREMLVNSHVSAPEQHSRKPIEWLRAMLRAWTDPGSPVLDLWAGLAPMAAACQAEGRTYLGAEIDPARHGHGLSLLRESL
jgi:hypothetical protein